MVRGEPLQNSMVSRIQRFHPGTPQPGFIPLLSELCAEVIGEKFEGKLT